MVAMKKIPPATEDNSGNNQQQQNQTTTTRTVNVSVVKKGETDTKIGSANVMIGTITGQTGTNGGQATLANVPDGTQTITVTATGYKTYTGSVVVESGMSTVVVELEEE